MYVHRCVHECACVYGSVDGTGNGKKRENGRPRTKTEEQVVPACCELRNSKKSSLQSSTLQIVQKKILNVPYAARISIINDPILQKTRSSFNSQALLLNVYEQLLS